MNYCQYLIITTRVPLVVDITVQRLDIDVTFGILDGKYNQLKFIIEFFG